MINNYSGNPLSSQQRTISNSSSVKSSLIAGNTEIGLGISYDFNSFSSSISSLFIHINDTTIHDNRRNLLIRNSDTVTLTNVTISNSDITGILLDNSKVQIQNNLTVSNNEGYDGGGIALNENSQLLPSPGTMIRLTGNRATHKGGAIFQGTLQINEHDITFPTKTNATFYFHNNTASVVGGDLYNTQRICALYT